MTTDLICANCEADLVLPDQPCPWCGCDETLSTYKEQ